MTYLLRWFADLPWNRSVQKIPSRGTYRCLTRDVSCSISSLPPTPFRPTLLPRYDGIVQNTWKHFWRISNFPTLYEIVLTGLCAYQSNMNVSLRFSFPSYDRIIRRARQGVESLLSGTRSDNGPHQICDYLGKALSQIA